MTLLMPRAIREACAGVGKGLGFYGNGGSPRKHAKSAGFSWKRPRGAARQGRNASSAQTKAMTAQPQNTPGDAESAQQDAAHHAAEERRRGTGRWRRRPGRRRGRPPGPTGSAGRQPGLEVVEDREEQGQRRQHRQQVRRGRAPSSACATPEQQRPPARTATPRSRAALGREHQRHGARDRGRRTRPGRPSSVPRSGCRGRLAATCGTEMNVAVMIEVQREHAEIQRAQLRPAADLRAGRDSVRLSAPPVRSGSAGTARCSSSKPSDRHRQHDAEDARHADRGIQRRRERSSATTKDSPMLMPITAIARVRTSVRVRSASSAVTDAETAPAPWTPRASGQQPRGVREHADQRNRLHRTAIRW